ncbi:hypothetical protein [Pseudogemmobacter sp. W21_MBD1_M6]|uniref:hypothetical protein n=1 Tax=Pseudogemmobacter sp. W21_MBD1_M6 TaxID=3240271 RepID=UPI003F9B15FD
MNAFSRSVLKIPLLINTAPSSSETSDAYTGVIFTDADCRLRIITCRDHLQWIVQVRSSLSSKSVRPWKAIGFCATRQGLLRVMWNRRTAVDGLHEFLMRLPERLTRKLR